MAAIYQICELQDTEAAETWLNFTDLGISAPFAEYVIAGTDTWSFSVSSQSAFTDAANAIFAYKKVLRIGRVVDGATRELLFLGRVERDPRRFMDGASESYTVKLLGLWDWFEKTPMRQEWTETAGTISKPRAILFCDAFGGRMTTGAQIEQCIAVARAAGCPVAAPSAGDILTGLTPPFDEQPNISVAQAVIKSLVNHPHAAAWFDYSTREPVMYVQSRTNLTAVDISIAGCRDISVVPRNDQVPPCIALCFEKSVTIDDSSSLSTTIDYAPVIEGETTEETDTRLKQVDAIWGIYDLDGSSTFFEKQKIVVKDGYLGAKYHVSWWKRILPWLADYADADITLSNVTSTATEELPNILIEGTVKPWMKKKFERQQFSVDAKLSRTVDGNVTDVKKQKLIVELPMTDATSKTYRLQSSYDPGESIPTGVAAALWTEFNQLHYDGSISDVAQEPPFTLMPGKTINLTDGLAELATMAAMINRVSIDIDSGTTSVEFGIAAWIDLDSRVAWFRNCNQRSAAYSRIYRDEPEPDDTDDGAEGSPNIRDGQTPAQNYRKRFIADGDTNHVIDINPADITGETAEMKPREVKIVESDGGDPAELTQKTYQLMATEGAEPEAVKLSGAADFDALVAVKSIDVESTDLKIIFSTKNTITGEDGEDVEGTMTLTEVDLIADVGYGSRAFNKTPRTIKVLHAEDAGSAEDYISLVSHASQHPDK